MTMMMWALRMRTSRKRTLRMSIRMLAATQSDSIAAAVNSFHVYEDIEDEYEDEDSDREEDEEVDSGHEDEGIENEDIGDEYIEEEY